MNRHQLAKKTKHLTQWCFINFIEIVEHQGDIDLGEISFETESDLIDWYKFEQYTTWYEAGDSEKFTKQRFVDEVPITAQHLRYGNTVELVEVEEKYVRNDIPDIVTFWEQGSSERMTPWLDGDYQYPNIKGYKATDYIMPNPRPVGIMNDRDFRERCKKVGNTLQVVQLRTCEDDLRIMHKPEWLQEELDCDFEDAMTIATAFTKMGISRNMCGKMINGYYDNDNAVWRNGLKEIGRERSRIYAEKFEDICRDLEDVIDEKELNRQYYLDVSRNMIESGDWCLRYGTNEPYWNDQMEFIENATYYDNLTVVEIEQEDEFEGYMDSFGDEEYEPAQDVTNTWRLFNGSETLDHDTISIIKSATICEYKNDKCKGICRDIGNIVRKMYPQWNGYQLVKAEWGYNKTWWLSGWMTYQQTQMAWWYINDARDRIAKECKPHITADSRKVLNQTRDMPIRRARAYMATYCAGNAFDLDGKEISWKHRPDEKEKYAIWDEFKKISKK